MDHVAKKLKQNRAFYCLECGKCTAVCPISVYNDSYSPRRLLAEGVFYNGQDLVSDNLLWSCLTCQLCSQRCPVDVRYSEYMRDMRVEAANLGKTGSPSHGGALHYIMEIAAAPKLKQNRNGWIEKNLKVKKKSDYLYFVGCLPYYQDFFSKEFEFEPINIAKDTVKILNHIGIEPAVMDNERCCGHDLYWLGQLEKFDEIGKLNLEAIEEAGAKTIITACPECALTLKQLYPERIGNTGLEIKHITQLVAENIDDFKFKETHQKVSFQDPCRLGRYLDIYDQPRHSMTSIPGVELKEMLHSKRGAICCGTTNWMNCDAVSRRIQQSRLNEAKNAGADLLVTACPKCQIHFRCSERGEETDKVGIEITDFVTFLASALDS
jgi:Fe-S oxidoreductase